MLNVLNKKKNKHENNVCTLITHVSLFQNQYYFDSKSEARNCRDSNLVSQKLIPPFNQLSYRSPLRRNLVNEGMILFRYGEYKFICNVSTGVYRARLHVQATSGRVKR